jgi:predicted RecA/RadA family phage recombinase
VATAAPLAFQPPSILEIEKETPMRNYIQRGIILSLLAPYALAAGAGALVGSIFCVANAAAASGAAFEGQTTGVFDLVKLAGTAWAVGDKVYWDNTNKRCTVVSSGNTLIGAAVAIADSAAVVGRVYVHGNIV